MPSVSVVIPTLNGGPLFAQVLDALRKQQVTEPLEILVIDSGSTDDTVSAAKAAGAKVVEIEPSTFDHGLTRNKGIELSTGELVILMTQDALPADEHMIGGLIGAFDDPQVAGAFARQIPRPEHDVLVARNINNWIAGSCERRISQITDRAAYEAMHPMERYLLCVFDNVCSAVRRSVWQLIPFRQNAFGEDVDWSKRTLEEGWKIVYEPMAKVIHSHDRPARYEYKRTYMCHQTLSRLFDLATIPAASYVPRCLLTSMANDWAYVWRNEQDWTRRWSLLARVPLLSWGSVLGQYRGARDQRRGKLKRIAGV